MEYYVFNDEATAVAAEVYIRQHGELPRVGVNALTGVPEPEKQKTEAWAIPVQRLDGKWCFPRLAPYYIENCTQDEIATFFNTFNPVIEIFNTNWFPEGEI